MYQTDGDQIFCMIVYFLVLEQIYEVAKTPPLDDGASIPGCQTLIWSTPVGRSLSRRGESQDRGSDPPDTIPIGVPSDLDGRVPASVPGVLPNGKVSPDNHPLPGPGQGRDAGVCYEQ